MIRTEIDITDLQRVVRSMPSVMKYVMGDALAYAGNKFMKEWHSRRFQGEPGVKERSRSRGLFSSFKKTVVEENGGLGLKIKSDNYIAHRQEFGATMIGTPGNRVPVPLSKQTKLFTKTGGINNVWSRSGKAFANLIPILFKGQFYLTQVKRYKTKKDVVTPLFVLKDRVVIKPRLGYRDTFEDMKPTLYGLLAQRLIRGVKQEWVKGEVSFSV
jgi:hypothetical protein